MGEQLTPKHSAKLETAVMSAPDGAVMAIEALLKTAKDPKNTIPQEQIVAGLATVLRVSAEQK